MKITNRESAVLDFLVQGLSNKEIARELSISDHTVRDHISSIMRKTNTANRVELAVLINTLKNSDSNSLSHIRLLLCQT
ncbi:LuxR C-terminal-related transcriptional regulator [Pseudomonas sp. G11]|uniref:response regulator transcription factor n=1 Tax=Pseudomonas TaxID=286 RepID=UPI00143D2F11|nr:MULTISPECIES: LuxR C-terminal-related transcriptional regulator [Pseudomonas]WEX15913.1 LuxR C-terminal-related transcriptional regulator [Pseudomonas sp. G11]